MATTFVGVLIVIIVVLITLCAVLAIVGWETRIK